MAAGSKRHPMEPLDVALIVATVADHDCPSTNSAG
jgi:hypothetical protein